MSKYNKGATAAQIKTKTTKDHITARHVANQLLDNFFEKQTSVGKQRIIAASFGEVGTLKTSFWLTAPGPVLVVGLDRGTEGVLDVYLKKLEDDGIEKSIYLVEYDANTHLLAAEADAQAAAEEVAAKIEKDFKDAIDNGIRTIVVDKETQMYEIFKYAVLGAPTGAPSNYYPLFQRYRALINMAKDSDINLGLIQGMYVGGCPRSMN